MNDEQDQSRSGRCKPTLRQALFSFPFLSNTALGWALLGCFWMPFGIGCDKTTVIIPYEAIRNEPPEGWSDCLFATLLHWPFLFGGLFALLLTGIVIARPANLGTWLLPLPITVLLGIVVSIIAAMLVDENDNSAGETATGVLIFAGPPLAVTAWSLTALRHRHGRRDRLLAATRAICGLSILVPPMLYCYGMSHFASRYLIGFYVAAAAGIAMTVSSWFLYTRGEQVFSDVTSPRRIIQFRIRTLMAWTTIIAAASAVVHNWE